MPLGCPAAQAPPTDRRYRAALATAIEPCGASFRRLIAAALTTESRLLRAAVVRVLARAAGEGVWRAWLGCLGCCGERRGAGAGRHMGMPRCCALPCGAGLGGGMGPFLVEPLLEELQTVAESPAPLHDARRLLEVGCAGERLRRTCDRMAGGWGHAAGGRRLAWPPLSATPQVIVPLVYRPAIKSAMLAAPFTSTLAHLLSERHGHGMPDVYMGRLPAGGRA